MNFFETLRSAIQNIFSNKMRTLLTTLGIIIGISSVIIITSLGNGLKDGMNEQFSSVSSVFQIRVTSNTDTKITSKDKLTLKDLDIVKSYDGVQYVGSTTTGWGGETVKLLDPTKTKRAMTSGINPDYYYLNDEELLYGRYIAEADLTARSDVVVIYDTLAKKVFGYENAVGQKISVKGYFGTKKYTVIGILKNSISPEMEAMYGEWFSENIFAPITTVMSQYGDKNIYSIIAKVEDKTKLEETSQNVIKLLEQEHGNAGKGIYLPNDNTNTIEQINGMLDIFTLFIGFVAAISLLVGGIGVMNIMMVTVTERTREIGIRKSIGAKNSDIRMQFIVESIILTAIGGILGMILGALGGIGLANLIPPSAFIGMMGKPMQIYASISPGTVVFAVGVSSLIGIVFGVYPANKAAKLDPIDALRYE